MAEKKVFMDSSSKATFICPKCDKAKRVDVSEYRDIQKAVKVRCKCSCGHSYMVHLERRSFYRKATDLKGMMQLRKGNGKWEIDVKDLSRTGLQVGLKEPVVRLEPGDRIFLEFQLLDNNWVKKDAIVRTIFDNGVKFGAEFVHPLDISPLDVA